MAPTPTDSTTYVFSPTSLPVALSYEHNGRTAVITMNKPKTVNALSQDEFYLVGAALRRLAKEENVTVVVLTGKGKFFSAGADITAARSSTLSPTKELTDTYPLHLRSFLANNLALTYTLATFPKILIGCMNGPAIGIAAAMTCWCDFVYAVPEAYLLTPFSSLGLIAEGGTSVGFVRKMGEGRAREVLLMGRKVDAWELEKWGYVNRVFEGCVVDDGKAGGETLVQKVLSDVVLERLGEHLVPSSLVGIKKLMNDSAIKELESAALREGFEAMDLFMNGIPQAEFGKLARGEKRHKL